MKKRNHGLLALIYFWLVVLYFGIATAGVYTNDLLLAFSSLGAIIAFGSMAVDEAEAHTKQNRDD